MVTVMRRGVGGRVGQDDGACSAGVDEGLACHQDGWPSCGWFTGRHDWYPVRPKSKARPAASPWRGICRSRAPILRLVSAPLLSAGPPAAGGGGPPLNAAHRGSRPPAGQRQDRDGNSPRDRARCS